MRRAILTAALIGVGLAAASLVHSAGRGPERLAAPSPVTSATASAVTSPSAAASAPASASAVASDTAVPVTDLAASQGALGEPYPLPSPFPDECRPRAFAVGEPCPLAPPGSSFRRVVGEAGIGPGQMADPRAIACSPEGWLYVVDKRGRIQSFDPELRPRAVVRTPQLIAGCPTGLTVDGAGKLVVADTHYARVLTYTRDLALEGAWGRPGTPRGGFKLLADARWGPEGLFYTLDYTADLARVQVWRGAEVVRTFGRFGPGPGELQRPMALSIDEKRGELLVADAENHRVQVLGLADGAFRRSYGGVGTEPGQLRFPYDVSVDEEGRAWVAEFGNHRIQVFDREGRSLGTWGAPGRHPGELAEPWGVALGPGGLVYVLDSGNNRVYEVERATVLGAKK